MDCCEVVEVRVEVEVEVCVSCHAHRSFERERRRQGGSKPKMDVAPAEECSGSNYGRLISRHFLRHDSYLTTSRSRHFPPVQLLVLESARAG